MSNNWQFQLFAQKGTWSSFVQPLLLLQQQSAEFGTPSQIRHRKSAAVSSSAWWFFRSAHPCEM